jgi:WD40 repeat protein
MGDADKFPRITTAILQVHSDEVWNLEWSHNGKFLASASKDRSVVIWSVTTTPNPDVALHLDLRGHPFSVGCLAWSPDDTILLSSSEVYIKMWNTETGICIRTIEAHMETVSALAWVPDGSGFISGSQDRKINLWARHLLSCSCLSSELFASRLSPPENFGVHHPSQRKL